MDFAQAKALAEALAERNRISTRLSNALVAKKTDPKLMIELAQSYVDVQRSINNMVIANSPRRRTRMSDLEDRTLAATQAQHEGLMQRVRKLLDKGG